MDPFSPEAVRSAYDLVATDYATAFADDLRQLPLDVAVLDEAAASLTGDGPVLDLGCGPGQVGQHLAGRGVRVIGIDLAAEMLRATRIRAPNLPVINGDVRSLPVRSESCVGAVAFYSLQHLPRSVLPAVLAEIRRTLVQHALLVVATHLGEGELFVDEFLGHMIQPVGGTLYGALELRQALTDGSFVIEAERRRSPLPHEHQSTRIYLTARAS